MTTALTVSTPAHRPAAGEDWLYRFEAKNDVLPLGLVPEGLRMLVTYDGRVTKGLLEGGWVRGVDHLLLRSDGVGIIDTEKTISLGDTHLYEHVRGYCMPPEGMEMPPLQAILEPGFTFPDVPFPILGFSTFRAGAPELAYLNRAIARIEGWTNFPAHRLVIETRLIEHSGEVAL